MHGESIGRTESCKLANARCPSMHSWVLRALGFGVFCVLKTTPYYQHGIGVELCFYAMNTHSEVWIVSDRVLRVMSSISIASKENTSSPK